MLDVTQASAEVSSQGPKGHRGMQPPQHPSLSSVQRPRSRSLKPKRRGGGGISHTEEHCRMCHSPKNPEHTSHIKVFIVQTLPRQQGGTCTCTEPLPSGWWTLLIHKQVKLQLSRTSVAKHVHSWNGASS